MAQGRLRRPLTVRRCVSPEPLSAVDVARVERLIARLAAQAYAAQHSRLFGPVGGDNGDCLDTRGSGEEH